jgi:Domain of unknown function (DUF4149)
MQKTYPYLQLFSLALWWGSLTTIGFIVIPLLFQHLPNRQVAGQMAAQLFRYQAFVSWACCALLIFIQYRSHKLVMSNVLPSNRAQGNNRTFIFVGLIFSLIVFWIVAPQIVLRQNLKLWHALGTALYAGQWLCASVLLYRQSYSFGGRKSFVQGSPTELEKALNGGIGTEV